MTQPHHRQLHLTQRGQYEVLAEVGVTDLRAEAPLLADAYGLADPAEQDAWDYEVDRSRAPFLLLHGRRSGTRSLSEPYAP